MELIGYHGTSKEIAASIVESDFNTNSKVGWLGTGTYFFEENLQMAQMWAKDKKKFDEINVLRCEINVDDDKIFFPSIPGTPDNHKFHMYRDKLKLQLKLRGLKLKVKDKQEFDGKTYNFICKTEGYELVKAFTNTYDDVDADYQIFSRVANAIELCVRSNACIRKKEAIECS
ncbi:MULTISPECIES: hypothetical protein [Bacillus cereus group]|uniref:hypothetical protein n=1 Tax=Bacillus cereus group TaxID=86661 RepID=UPI000BF576B1|nr:MULTISPECIES: hypothetical protein [Bacillus cereus group]MCU7668172.1 hypothetical protein [Bacillus thuringiensis]PEQ76576.1 hypothetical protein CN482_28910 [Bacillus cereus]PEY11302.1 hypothetical protein CN342_30235 [Bacillus cereus]PFM73865.1 hypothetical protein COJ54_24645 [Bacillus cereus]